MVQVQDVELEREGANIEGKDEMDKGDGAEDEAMPDDISVSQVVLMISHHHRGLGPDGGKIVKGKKKEEYFELGSMVRSELSRLMGSRHTTNDKTIPASRCGPGLLRQRSHI